MIGVTMDYQKNISVPNIETSLVYFKRQFSCYLFNVHTLHNQDVTFYAYGQNIAKKGSNDVVSMLDDFLRNIDCSIKTVHIFCDSCAGQNKNWTVFRYLHFLVLKLHKFTEVFVHFPIRGHSYMESDRDMGSVSKVLKKTIETPSEWFDEIRKCRTKPTPFNVPDVNQSMFKNWSKFLEKKYPSKCPIPTQPIREIVFSQEGVKYRNSFMGLFQMVNFDVRKSKLVSDDRVLEPLYDGQLSISEEKFNDLVALKPFVSEKGKMFIDSLVPDLFVTEDFHEVCHDNPDLNDEIDK